MFEMKMSEAMVARMEEIYTEMEAAYDRVAADLGFSCEGCPDNCCDSYFLHHTYIEWSYLWLGLQQLPPEKQKEIIEKSKKYLEAASQALGREERPQLMCPLNEKGLCILYKHRLMVCRTHGVPANITRPDGQKISFPGCFRCQELETQGGSENVVERTSMLRKLALLENEYLENKRHLYPRVKLTIAEMIVRGLPQKTGRCL